MNTKSYAIEGMTCAACASNVERTAKKVSGVVEASVNLAADKLNLKIDETQFDAENLAQEIDASGYTVVMPQLVTRSFDVEGMTCASCSATVEKTAGKMDGMEKASVNLATEKLTVTYNPLTLSVRDIADAVSKSGYQAHLEQEDQRESPEIEETEKESKEEVLRKRTI